MRASDLLSSFGLFVEPDVLDAELCSRIRDEMLAASEEAAEVVRQGARQIDSEMRRTKIVKVSTATQEQVESKVVALKPRLEQHFGLSLGKLYALQFLRYRVGDFFRLHVDDESETSAKGLSLVVFLNAQSNEPLDGTYGEGALTFYGLLDDPGAEKIGLPMAGEPGELVAFPSNILHEVNAVTHGERLTIVTWFSPG